MHGMKRGSLAQKLVTVGDFPWAKGTAGRKAGLVQRAAWRGERGGAASPCVLTTHTSDSSVRVVGEGLGFAAQQSYAALSLLCSGFPYWFCFSCYPVAKDSGISVALHSMYIFLHTPPRSFWGCADAHTHSPPLAEGL